MREVISFQQNSFVPSIKPNLKDFFSFFFFFAADAATKKKKKTFSCGSVPPPLYLWLPKETDTSFSQSCHGKLRRFCLQGTG